MPAHTLVPRHDHGVSPTQGAGTRTFLVLDEAAPVDPSVWTTRIPAAPEGLFFAADGAPLPTA